MDTFTYIVLGILLIAVMLLIGKKYIKTVIIFEFEKGLQYHKGKLAKVLEAGKYFYFSATTTIMKIDIRPRILTVAGQEVLTSDCVSIKVSTTMKYRVADVTTAVNSSEDYNNFLYSSLQTVLRILVSESTVDDLLENRTDCSRRLFEEAKEAATECGLELLSASIKDIMLTGDLKKTFTQVIKARKESLAALEKARGESAALRNLANAARMMEGNPNLMMLRMLQTVSDTSGNTIVLNLEPQDKALPVIKKGSQAPEVVIQEEES